MRTEVPRSSMGGPRQQAAAMLLALAVACSCCVVPAAANACLPYVYPCACGLCPRIVDCAVKETAECFCGTAAPGIYPHPHDLSRFWMCSFDSASQLPYGVEVMCPARLVFDPVVKVCTVPSAVSAATPAAVPAVASPAPAKAAPAQAIPDKAATGSSRTASSPAATFALNAKARLGGIGAAWRLKAGDSALLARRVVP